MEEAVNKKGLNLSEMSLNEMDAVWNEIKKQNSQNLNWFRNNNFLKRNSFLLIAAAWLFTFAFIIDNYWSGSSPSNAAQKAIQRDIDNKLIKTNTFYVDSSKINEIISGKYDEKELQKQVDKKYFIFIYKIGSGNNLIPVFWNTQIIAPNSFILHSDNGIGFRKLLNGWYVTNKKTYQSASGVYYKVVFLIPVKWNYYIQNQYLHNTFVAENNIEKAYDITLTPTRYVIKDLQGNPLFYLRQLTNPVGHDNLLAMLLRILASIFILFFIHRLANYNVQKRGFWIGLSVLLVPLILLRTLSYLFPIPLNFKSLELFDPSIYGANYILRSLG